MFGLNLPVPLRVNPTITTEGGFSNCRIKVNGQDKIITSFSLTSMCDNILTMIANTAANLNLDNYIGAVTIKGASGSNFALNLSADL